jgi:hypothetical protein
MLTHENAAGAHAGEDQASSEFAARSAHLAAAVAGVAAARVESTATTECWSVGFPHHAAKSLAELAKVRQWLQPGDVVYVADVRRHILTEDYLNAAARAAGGGAQ